MREGGCRSKAAKRGASEREPAGKLAAMNGKNTIFGWAFGDSARAEDEEYLATLRHESLENARQDAARQGVQIDPSTAVFTVVSEDDSLIDAGEAARGRVTVRCTVHVEGPGADEIRAEGPMNG